MISKQLNRISETDLLKQQISVLSTYYMFDSMPRAVRNMKKVFSSRWHNQVSR